jgi:hypothetical protein
LFTDAEIEYLMGLVDQEWEYWATNLETEDERRVVIIAGTLHFKLHGDLPEKAELLARRQVDEWWTERNAPGGL